MRHIKFRAKRLDNGKWAYGGLIEADDYCIIDQRNELYVERDYVFRGDTHFFQLSGVMCDEKTIGQFTGLLDKNGKEIYEGDIVVYGSHCKHIVEFKHGMFGYTLLDGWFVGYGGNSNFTFNPLDISKEHEVIGNIHDNPELLSENNHVKLDRGWKRE